MAIHIVPPSLRNQGTALAALLMIGEYGQGERGVGNMSAFWDGGDGLNIPYYGSQTLGKFFLEVCPFISVTSTYYTNSTVIFIEKYELSFNC